MQRPELFFRFEDRDTAGPDAMEAYWHEGSLHISIENPWAGDSESGFGATTDIALGPREAKWFIEWLKAWAHAAA